MKLIDSDLVPYIKEVYQNDLGTFYFFDNYIVSEINEGQIFNWESLKVMISFICDFYGKNTKVHVISNRVQNYSVVPTYWIEFYKSIYSKSILSVSFITYSELGLSNAKLEQDFIKGQTACFTKLQDAIDWTKILAIKKTA